MITRAENFTHVGRVVTHRAEPHFSLVFQPAADGAWESGEVAWVDGTPVVPADAAAARRLTAQIARLMRQAGDYWRAHCRDDWVQERVIARAAELGLTAYAIAKATGGAVGQDHVKDYLSRKKSMGSHKLQHILRVLGMDVRSR